MSHRITRLVLAAVSLAFAGAAVADPIVLDDTIRCSEGAAINGIAVGDVTGNAGGATDCWGTYNGNDPGPSGDGFDLGGTIFSYVAKQNTPGILEGADIGLVVSPSGGAPSGTWAFNDSYNPASFLIVLKAANSPGFAAWLFRGTDADSYFGEWSVAWTNASGTPPALSHLAIYASGDRPPPPNGVPEPGTLALLGLGLVGVGLTRRRKKV